MVLTEVSRSRGTRFVAALAAAILAVPITTANAADTVLWLNGTESVVPGPPPSGPPGGPISVLHGAYGTNVVTVKYPASFWPLTAAADPTGPVLGVSVDEGIANLHKAIGSTSGTVAVVGTSQGSLVVDDVQWADHASWEALEHLMGAIDHDRLLLCLTIRREDALTQDGAEGVHLVMSYRSAAGAPEETIDQTSYLSDGKDAVYLLVVRCTTSCYDAYADQIRSVTSSYTIQGDTRG